MPEYLAPGVYVEETSFRAKSIEGVGTSTTAFVGPTLRGPIGGTPELLTSFGDFERIYGGLDDLSFGPNYIAHGVRNFFNEGGSRLYVSRVYLPGATDGTSSIDIIANGAAAQRARIVSRMPGAAANGRITLRQVATPATRLTMDNAPEGSLLRVGGANPATPAIVLGGSPPFSLPNDGVLRLTIGGNDMDITFRGEPAEAVGSTALPDPVVLDASNNQLTVNIDGALQTIGLPVGSTPRAELVALINQEIREGYARLTPGNELAIGSDRRGTLASVTVNANPALGFATTTTVVGSGDPNNNVSDLFRVTADDINALLTAATAGNPPERQVRATLSPVTNRLVLSTVGSGPGASLAVRDAGANSVHAALLLAAMAAAITGAAGTPVTYYVKRGGSWVDQNNTALDLSGLAPTAAPAGGADLLTLTIVAEDRQGNAMTYEDLGFDRSHPRWAGRVLEALPSRRIDDLQNLFSFQIGTSITPFALRDALFPTGDNRALSLNGANDGLEPNQAAYEAALAALEQLDDVSIVAAPGYSTYADAQGIQSALITHAERPRSYRIAVLDTAPGLTVSGARNARSVIDSKYAALYWPWVIISNPLARPDIASIPREIAQPPSSFICGIYARNDEERGVFKAPANEVIRSALRFETDVNFAQQEVLNPIGVNCLRFFPGRGYRVWGARTASSDPEWKYVNVRRYFNYLESSIDRGTQWAVFEPNGERLWANIRDTIGAFLYNEWINGALLGSSPQEAFFVRCDRSTMTQNDLDNGRLICLIGVAVIKPAEFVIFRIGQKTADART